MLKSLEVFGFKSFADRTVFEFAPGTTCVVGPNGSGKSNVVDAMKWLLGDQSPKSLRGKNMSDVIFNGSRSRKPSGFAEASLTFDNTHRILQIECDEVRITRRLYQGGDSEYLINNESSRLKDIRELFMGTGAATSAYSIIEQGRVGQVLQGNPSTRRVLFDEAAGISRFKVRRIDAERKLERVSQNLLRLTDIVDEVETQLNACRSQAGKAAKFRDLSRSYDALWLGLAADDARRLHGRVSELRVQSAALTERVNASRQENQAVENEREQLRLEFSRADEELQDVEGKLSMLMQQRSSLQTALHHQRDRVKEIETECVTLRKQRSDLKRRAQELEQEIAAIAQQCEQARLAVEQKQEARHSDEEQLQLLEQTIDQLRQERAAVSSQLQQQARQQAAAENHLSHLQARQRTLLTAVERTDAEIEAAQAECQRHAELVSAAEQVHHQALLKNESQRHEIELIAGRRASLKQEVAGIHARLRADREQRSAWEARLGLLEDMEKRQLGLSLGVQEILQRSRQSRLAPWKHVLGILPDFIECDFEYAPLIEIALQGGSHLIVVDQMQPIVDYLDRGETLFEGRLGFLEVPHGKTALQPDQNRLQEHPFTLQLQHVPEVLGRADLFVRCEALYRPLLERLLGHTWIVDRLATARRLAVLAPEGMQFLTQQGDLIDSFGCVHTGTLQPEGSVMSRRSEIRRIKSELIQLDRHIQRLTEKTGEMDQILLRFDEELRHAQEWMESQSQELTEYKQKWIAAQSEARLAEKEVQRLVTDRQSLLEQHVQVEQEIATEIERQFEIQTQIDQVRLAGQSVEERMQQTQKERQTLLQGRSQYQLELTQLEERQTAAIATLKRLRQDRQLRHDQHQEAVSRFELAVQKRSKTELQILNSQSRLSELYLIGEQLQVEVAVSRKKRHATQVHRDRLNDRLKQISEVRRHHEEQLQDARIELRDLENELQSLADKIYEEYQYPLRVLIAAGLSACHPYQTLRQGQEIEAIDYPARVTSTAPVAETGDDDNTPGLNSTPVEESPAAPIEAADAHEPAAAVAEAGGRAELDLLDLSGLEEFAWPWAESDLDFLEARDDIEREIQRLRKKIKALGAVDPESLKGLDELEYRFKHLNTQLQDLKNAQSTLQDIIRKINTESKRIFVESFTTIRAHFQELFRQLFGGGEGDVMMEDESDPLECGIEIVARPPGKELRSISLLSGGEKTMTAVGLLLAIFKSRPSPFCILDEVDAALDEANIDRFATVMGLFQDKTQFIVITHRKRTMTAADRIFGVTMEEAGVSKRLTVRFEDVGENGEIHVSGKNAA